MKLPAPTEEEKEMAGRYASVFLGNDLGRAVLADLRKRYGVARLRFVADDDGGLDHATKAAIIDGECRVLLHIELFLAHGAPGKGLPQIQPKPNP